MPRHPLPPRRLLLLAALVPTLAHAGPLSDHDNSPLTGIFGLPDATESGRLLAAGQSRWTASILLTSHSVADRAGTELFIADGETTRIALEWRRGFGKRWEFGAELPYLTHQPGGLDSVIDDWHKFFGFPDGARDDRPRDLLEFAYARDGDVGLDVSQSSHGPGDLRLFGGYRLRAGERHRNALRFGIELPTGEDGDLHGSGGADVSLGIAGDLVLGDTGAWSLFYGAHGVYLGAGPYLAERQKSFVAAGGFGVTWRAAGWMDLTLQSSVRGPLYDSGIEMLGEPAIALTFGGRFRLSERLGLAVAVGEDIKVESTPDVTFQLAIDYRP